MKILIVFLTILCVIVFFIILLSVKKTFDLDRRQIQGGNVASVPMAKVYKLLMLSDLTLKKKIAFKANTGDAALFKSDLGMGEKNVLMFGQIYSIKRNSYGNVLFVDIVAGGEIKPENTLVDTIILVYM
jgi:hypothetical protein